MARIINVFLAQITFMNKIWYLSDEGFSGEHYYAPYITKTPSLELGPIKGGYVGVKFGKLSILNSPYDEFSPFSIYSGGYKSLLNNPNQLIPTKLFYGERETALFDGSISLNSFNTDALTFFIENPEFSQTYLDEIRDVKATLVTMSVESLTKVSSGNVATVISPSHGLITGDLVTITSSTDANFDVSRAPVTVVNDSTFTYTAAGSASATSTSHIVKTFEKRVAPLAFGEVTLKSPLIQIEDLDTSNVSKGFAFDNPDLDHSNTSNRLKLYDDGVLHGTTNTSSVDATISGSGALVKVGNRVTCTLASHGLVNGEQISIEGAAPDEFNGTSFIVTNVPSSSTFEYIVVSNAAITDASVTVKKYGNYYGANRLPTASIIYSRETPEDNTKGLDMVGTPAISGISVHGSTVAEFFIMIKNKLGLTNVDFSNAPQCEVEKYQLWQTSQSAVVDYAGKIAKNSNYFFTVTSDTLTLFDRRHEPTESITFQNYELVNAGYKMAFPIQATQSEFSINVVDVSKTPTTMRSDKRVVRVNNLSSGEIVEFNNVTDNLDDQKTFLTNLLESETKVQITVKVGTINTDVQIGSRVKTEREEEGVDIDFIVDSIKFDFDSLTTDFSGIGSLTIIERETPY